MKNRQRGSAREARHAQVRRIGNGSTMEEGVRKRGRHHVPFLSIDRDVVAAQVFQIPRNKFGSWFLNWRVLYVPSMNCFLYLGSETASSNCDIETRSQSAGKKGDF